MCSFCLHSNSAGSPYQSFDTYLLDESDPAAPVWVSGPRAAETSTPNFENYCMVKLDGKWHRAGGMMTDTGYHGRVRVRSGAKRRKEVLRAGKPREEN